MPAGVADFLPSFIFTQVESQDIFGILVRVYSLKWKVWQRYDCAIHMHSFLT